MMSYKIIEKKNYSTYFQPVNVYDYYHFVQSVLSVSTDIHIHISFF